MNGSKQNNSTDEVEGFPGNSSREEFKCEQTSHFAIRVNYLVSEVGSHKLTRRIVVRSLLSWLSGVLACCAVTAESSAQEPFSAASRRVAAMSPSIQVTLEKRIKIPGIEARGVLTKLTRISWSGVTNQIATSASSSAEQYIVDPDSGKAVTFGTGSRVAVDTPLQWSREKPLLVVNKVLETRVYDTRLSPGRPPELVHEISTRVPRPLLSTNVSIVKTSQGEWVFLGGETNRTLDLTNPEIVAFSLDTGQRQFEWQFPNDGTHYYLRENVAAATASRPILAGWVQRSGATQFDRPRIETHTMWIIDLESRQKRCELNLAEEPNKFGLPVTGAPFLSSDGRWLVFSSGWPSMTYMYVYDTNNCRQLVKRRVDSTPAHGSYAFSPDGKWLVGTMPMFHGDLERGRISVWRTKDWGLVHDAPGSAHYVAAFNKTSDRFAVGLIGGIYIYRIIER